MRETHRAGYSLDEVSRHGKTSLEYAQALLEGRLPTDDSASVLIARVFFTPPAPREVEPEHQAIDQNDHTIEDGQPRLHLVDDCEVEEDEGELDDSYRKRDVLQTIHKKPP
ncbi:MAG: hypothetical protein Q4E05_08955 [Pseudoclavibacter sp.]|nr:hypothetical protein [Pseudoclavibacter sp.]